MSTSDSRPPRFTLLYAWLTAGAALGLLLGLVLGMINNGIPGMGILFAKGGIFFGFLTLFAALPVVFLLRALLRRVREPVEANWGATMSCSFALAAWFLAYRAAIPAAAVFVAVVLGALLGARFSVPKRPRLLAAGSLVLLIFGLYPSQDLSAGVGAGETPDETAERGRARPAAPDVVLVTVDTFRADRVGLYALDQEAPSLTPEIDRFGEEGLIFERALSSSPWTIPSMASLFTGLPALRHGAGLPLGGFALRRTGLAGEFETLAERFKAAGYETRGVTANGFITPGLGMAQGFDEYQNLWQNMSAVGMLYEMPWTRLIAAHPDIRAWGDFRARRVSDIAMEWLAQERSEPLFLWAHYIDPHMPYQADPDLYDPYSLTIGEMMAVPEPFEDGTIVGDVMLAIDKIRGGVIWMTEEDRRRMGEYYDRAVTYVDEHVGRLFEELRARRGGERPLIVLFTADHGEELWDHGGFEHGHDYYREVTRVPMILWGDDLPAARVESLVGLVDVAPTLLELAQIVPPGAEQENQAVDEGRSLTPLWQSPDTAAPRIRFAESNLYELPAALLEEGPWRFILRANGEKELYDANLDPLERSNRAHEHPELVERYTALLKPRLESFLENRPGGDDAMSPEELRALRSLGYI